MSGNLLNAPRVYIYIYIYTHTHRHTHMHVYMYIYTHKQIRDNCKPTFLSYKFKLHLKYKKKER